MSELPLLSGCGPPDTGLPGSGLLSGGVGEEPQRTRPAVIFKPANGATPWCYDPARPWSPRIVSVSATGPDKVKGARRSFSNSTGVFVLRGFAKSGERASSAPPSSSSAAYPAPQALAWQGK